MGAPVGRPKPAGSGIKKGQTHANSGRRTVREIVEAYYGKSLPEKMMELAAGDPEKELDVQKTLMPYAYPKLQATEMKIEPTQVASEKIDQLVELFVNLKVDA